MTSKRRAQRPLQPLDKTAITVIILLSVAIVLMLLIGTKALPHVRNFSWQRQQVSADDVAFSLTFTQPMEPESVEKNLKIEPELTGRMSWAGRRMAYTLDVPAPYGETFEVSLRNAQPLNRRRRTADAAEVDSVGFEPFLSEFRTRDRAFAYIGAEGEETGRLILFNLTQKEKAVLTPEDKIVLDFEPYPERDRILFSAVDKQPDDPDSIAGAKLYTVSTGLGDAPQYPWWQFWQQQESAAVDQPAGEVIQVLGNQDYQNLKFDLSPNGERVVIQRVNNEKPSDYGPWILYPDRPDDAPRKLKTEPGGDFLIAPDNVSLLFQQGQGTAVIDLLSEVDAVSEQTLLDFLPSYGLTLDVASDGSAAALVNFNQNDPEKRFTQSLFWVSNRGEEKPLLQTDGAIVDAIFSEDNEVLYCLVNRLSKNTPVEDLAEEQESDRSEDSSEGAVDTNAGSSELIENELIEPLTEDDSATDGSATGESIAAQSISDEPSSLEDEVYELTPYLTAVNVNTGEEQELLEMPPQPETNVSLAPDGLAILFDEVLVSNPQANAADSDQRGPTHRLWLLPLFDTVESRLSGEPTALPPTELEIAGRQPVWLP